MKLVELQQYELKDEILLEYEELKDKIESRPLSEHIEELDRIIEEMEAEENA